MIDCRYPLQCFLSALDPGKQGLKLQSPLGRKRRLPLSALDPGKQGLKHPYSLLLLPLDTFFQRLIQENKD